MKKAAKLMSEEEKLIAEAVEYVKLHKAEIVDQVLSYGEYRPSDNPVAVFMAGTPGAGKTEIAESLIELFVNEPIRIDADELRELIPGYDGSNSHIVQTAASIAVDKILDTVLSKHLPFILDATFAVGKAGVNIKRAVRKGYDTQIYFVYQDPVEAWKFTKIREQREGRFVPKEAFINAYANSRKNVQKVKQEFGDMVTLRLIIKNYSTGEHKVYDMIDSVEKYLPKPYNEEELKELLND